MGEGLPLDPYHWEMEEDGCPLGVWEPCGQVSVPTIRSRVLFKVIKVGADVGGRITARPIFGVLGLEGKRGKRKTIRVIPRLSCLSTVKEELSTG